MSIKKNHKNILISSIIPILFLLIAGSIIKVNWPKQKMDYTNESRNEVINVINQNEIENIEVDENETNNENNNINNNTNIIDETEENNEEPTKKPENQVEFDETAAFIGDSRTQGLIRYTGLSKVQDYSYIGLMVDTAITKEFVKSNNGEKITLLEDMKNKNIKKVYIMLGVNELGWSYPSVFKLKYEELIDEIRKVKPNCDIYVQSIIPVTKDKDKSDKIYNNTNINKFNKLIMEVAKEKNVTYLDVKSALIDNEGYLPSNASTDGIHIESQYCKKWLNYLKNNSNGG